MTALAVFPAAAAAGSCLDSPKMHLSPFSESVVSRGVQTICSVEGAAGYALDQVSRLGNGDFALGGCRGHYSEGTYDAAPVPVTDKLGGNNGWWQLFQEPQDFYYAAVFASWSIVTNNINGGADHYMFGAQFTNTDGTDGGLTNNIFKYRGGTCVWIGNNAQWGFEYLVHGGALAETLNAQCSWSQLWENTVGARISFVDGGGTTTREWGGSISCSYGGTLDSETTFYDSGFAQNLFPVPV